MRNQVQCSGDSATVSFAFTPSAWSSSFRRKKPSRAKQGFNGMPHLLLQQHVLGLLLRALSVHMPRAGTLEAEVTP